jgi:hypothetical protein
MGNRVLKGSKNGKLQFRELSRKEKIINFLITIWIFILKITVLPAYFAWIGIRKFFHWILWDREMVSNGIFGPGYSCYYKEKFSWGKLSFVLVVLFIITFLIFLR